MSLAKELKCIFFATPHATTFPNGKQKKCDEEILALDKNEIMNTIQRFRFIGTLDQKQNARRGTILSCYPPTKK